MTKEELNLLKEVNIEMADNVERKIKESYNPSRAAKFAHGVTTFWFYFGWIIFISLFQAMTSMTYHTERKFKKAAIMALLSFNIFFFLYAWEPTRYKKYYEQELKMAKFPDDFKKIKAGIARLEKYSDNDITLLKNKVLSTIAIPNVTKYTELGIVYGSSVRSANFLKDISSFTKSVGGGKIVHYKTLMNQTRESAMDDIVRNAIKQHESFDAIYNVRMESVSISQSNSEIVVYGTVVKFSNKK